MTDQQPSDAPVFTDATAMTGEREVMIEVDVEDAAVAVTVMGSVEPGVLGEESELSAHATAPRARSRSAVVLITRRPTARSTPHIGLSSA